MANRIPQVTIMTALTNTRNICEEKSKSVKTYAANNPACQCFDDELQLRMLLTERNMEANLGQGETPEYYIFGVRSY